jgi:hypothetical protein
MELSAGGGSLVSFLGWLCCFIGDKFTKSWQGLAWHAHGHSLVGLPNRPIKQALPARAAAMGVVAYSYARPLIRASLGSATRCTAAKVVHGTGGGGGGDKDVWEV